MRSARRQCRIDVDRQSQLEHLDFIVSSRRRHTRSLRDWSSDVCSSDLRRCSSWKLAVSTPSAQFQWRQCLPTISTSFAKIGRASCRERVYTSEAAVATKKEDDEAENVGQLRGAVEHH